MTDQTARMHKGVDLWAVVALGLGTAVGVAIFSVIAPATALAGPGMLLAVVVAAVLGGTAHGGGRTPRSEPAP